MPSKLTSKLKAKYEAERVARVQKYGLEVTRLYNEAIDAASLAADGVQLKDGVFSLSKYPGLNVRVNRILAKLAGNIETMLYKGVLTEWNKADTDNDQLFDQVLKRKRQKSGLLNGRNEDAFKAFRDRVDKKGLNLSKRIYKQVGTFRQELEVGLGDGILYGKSAQRMARDLKGTLAEPDKLFRRVKKEGKLKLSKNALDYHPGQGIYRSSHQNILRTTITETNMAYRKADSVRYQASPFVIGFRVKLSNRHPTYDICDELAGLYPKTFIFLGFHPRCICYEIPELLTPEQYDKMENDLLAGKDITKIQYTDKPAPDGAHAKAWFEANKDRIDNWKSKPYFLEDNASFFKK